jgi:hypothetical protein
MRAAIVFIFAVIFAMAMATPLSEKQDIDDGIDRVMVGEFYDPDTDAAGCSAVACHDLCLRILGIKLKYSYCSGNTCNCVY